MQSSKDHYPSLSGIADGPVNIYRDGAFIVTVDSPNDAFNWLAKNTNQSVSYALVHGGYSCLSALDV
jgi:hypothetical protein